MSLGCTSVVYPCDWSMLGASWSRAWVRARVLRVQQSDIRWASRWDTYLLMTDDQIHWFSIINSLMIVLFLSGMVAMIMMRTLHRDISKYNQLETAEEAQEETGWKLVGSSPLLLLSAFLCSACKAAVPRSRC